MPCVMLHPSARKLEWVKIKNTINKYTPRQVYPIRRYPVFKFVRFQGKTKMVSTPENVLHEAVNNDEPVYLKWRKTKVLYASKDLNIRFDEIKHVYQFTMYYPTSFKPVGYLLFATVSVTKHFKEWLVFRGKHNIIAVGRNLDLNGEEEKRLYVAICDFNTKVYQYSCATLEKGGECLTKPALVRKYVFRGA